MATGRTDNILDRFGLTLQDLAGAKVSGEIPFTNAVVNRFIAAQLATRQTPFTSVAVEAREGDAIAARIVAKARLVPPIRILARIDRQPVFPDKPVLGLQWSLPGVGPLALFAAPALAFFNALPGGVTADRDRIAIDVRQLLISRGLGDLVALVRRLEVHTRAGAFVVKFEIGM